MERRPRWCGFYVKRLLLQIIHTKLKAATDFSEKGGEVQSDVCPSAMQQVKYREVRMPAPSSSSLLRKNSWLTANKNSDDSSRNIVVWNNRARGPKRHRRYTSLKLFFRRIIGNLNRVFRDRMHVD